jgi:hypothetical protein
MKIAVKLVNGLFFFNAPVSRDSVPSENVPRKFPRTTLPRMLYWETWISQLQLLQKFLCDL